MSRTVTSPKPFGPSQRFFDQNVKFKPFEVIDVGDTKVAVNEGTLIVGHTSIALDKCHFDSTARPQNLMGESMDSSLFLSVAADVEIFVCIVVKNAKNTVPSAELLALTQEDLDGTTYKRNENQIFKLAKIRDTFTQDLGDISFTILDIENLYDSNILAESENWAAFTPTIWQVEGTTEDTPPADPEETTDSCGDTTPNDSKSFKATFIPGSIYLPQTMDQPITFQLGNQSMDDYPVVDVSAGDEYVIEYSISSNWSILGTPTFKKISSDSELPAITEVIPPQKDYENGGGIVSDSFHQDGTFTMKVLRFEKEGDGLVAKIFWRSDIVIYGWQRDKGGEGENHPWKVILNGDGLLYCFGGIVYGQGTPIEVAPKSFAVAQGVIYLQIARAVDSRDMTTAELLFSTFAAFPTSDQYYQVRAIANILVGSDSVPYIYQLQFEEIRIEELLIVTNGAFQLAAMEMSSRNTYDPPT